MTFEQGALQDASPTPKRAGALAARGPEEVQVPRVSIQDGFLEVRVERSSALARPT